jgi:hypothetical protein
MCEMPETERRDKPNGEERHEGEGICFCSDQHKNTFSVFDSFYSFFVQIKNDSGLVRVQS